ncbi:MAG: VCBS repeat-containing protein [Flammeovirgaceae bacterium]|nr:VCBS repeat-containing protein [Flammeovirgaceae bacterium]
MAIKNLKSILSKADSLLRFQTSLAEDLHSGRFYRYSPRKKNWLRSKFAKLRSRLSILCNPKQAAVAGSALLLFSIPTQTEAQQSFGPFVKRDRSVNPLRFPIQRTAPKPTAVDLDNDGDYDIAIGNRNYGEILLHRNVGTTTSPLFTASQILNVLGTSGFHISFPGSPAFADIDKDGDLDLFIGSFTGSPIKIQYFVNNGGSLDDGSLAFQEQVGPWNDATKAGNPFDGVNPGDNVNLTFVDFDGDTHMDAFMGHDYDEYGQGITIKYFKNDGQGNFIWQNNFFPPSFEGSYGIAPQVADLDLDGDLDLLLGNYGGELKYYVNDGVNNFTLQSGPWSPATKTGNPFDGAMFLNQTHPLLVDLDSDGDLDATIGHYSNNYNNTLRYLKHRRCSSG